MSYRELVDWGLYYGVEPWGEWRADVRSAQISAILANTNRDPKRRPEPYKIEEFLMFQQKDETSAAPASNGGAKMDPQVMAWLFSKSGTRLKD